MHLAHEVISTEESKQRVNYRGESVSSKEYVEEIVTGFRNMYTFVKEHRTQLLQEGRALLSMAHLPVRFILRLTGFYARLLQRLSDPQVILNAGLIDQELEALPTYLIEKGKEHLIVLVEEEKRALLQGDVPFFTALPAQTHLFAKGKIK